MSCPDKIRDLSAFLRLFLLPRVALVAENLFLRKQLALFQERKARRRRATAATRTWMVVLGRCFDWRGALVGFPQGIESHQHRFTAGCTMIIAWEGRPLRATDRFFADHRGPNLQTALFRRYFNASTQSLRRMVRLALLGSRSFGSESLSPLVNTKRFLCTGSEVLAYLFVCSTGGSFGIRGRCERVRTKGIRGR